MHNLHYVNNHYYLYVNYPYVVVYDFLHGSQTFQSSLDPRWAGTPDKAVDGNASPNYFTEESCT